MDKELLKAFIELKCTSPALSYNDVFDVHEGFEDLLRSVGEDPLGKRGCRLYKAFIDSYPKETLQNSMKSLKLLTEFSRSKTESISMDFDWIVSKPLYNFKATDVNNCFAEVHKWMAYLELDPNKDPDYVRLKDSFMSGAGGRLGLVNYALNVHRNSTFVKLVA